MKKVCSSHLTAGMLSQNFSETVKSFIVNNKKAYHVINTIKSTPSLQESVHLWSSYNVEIARVPNIFHKFKLR